MRHAFAIVASLAIACGGAKSPPPDTDVTAGASRREPHPEPMPTAAPDAAAPEPTATASATATPPPEEPPKDPNDPWLSHRQIPPDIVAKTVKPAAAKVQKCLKDAHKRDPSLEGEVHIRFVVSHDGKVLDFHTGESSIGDKDVTSCVGEVIKTLKFPEQPAPGGAFGVYATHLSN
jgi:hypothetical protein